MVEETAGKAQILIVDDERQIRRFLRISLEANGYQVHEVENGADAIQRTAQLRPDLVILDMGLPDLDGLEVLRRLREWATMPIIILSVRDSDRDKVGALDNGADDYLTKPFSTEELLARIRVALRHTRSQEEPAIFRRGSLVVDLTRRLVTVRGEPIKLTPTESAADGAARGQGVNAPADLARGVGARLCERDALPARLLCPITAED